MTKLLKVSITTTYFGSGLLLRRWDTLCTIVPWQCGLDKEKNKEKQRKRGRERKERENMTKRIKQEARSIKVNTKKKSCQSLVWSFLFWSCILLYTCPLMIYFYFLFYCIFSSGIKMYLWPQYVCEILPDHISHNALKKMSSERSTSSTYMCLKSTTVHIP